MGNIKYLFSCMVLTKQQFASNGRNEGTKMLLLAVCIFIMSGIKLCDERTSFFNNLIAIRQLWHSVPATAEIWVIEVNAIRLWLSHK